MTTWSRKHLLQKVFSKSGSITSIWKCFLQVFSVKYHSDTISWEKTNLCYKGGCYHRQIRKQSQTTFYPWVIFNCCFVGTSKSLVSLQGQLLSTRMPGPTSQDVLHGHSPQPVVIAALALLQAVPVVSLPAGAGLQPTCNPAGALRLRSLTWWGCSGEQFENLGPVSSLSVFSDWRRHLRAPSCLWEESELWIRMSASIIKETITGSAGFLKTCCWWRCRWETWHSRAKLCSLMACVLAALGNWQERCL